MKKIIIIWWSWSFWSFLAEYLKKYFNNFFDIYISWRNIVKLQNVAEKLNIWYYTSIENAIIECDIIVFWVSIAETKNTIKKYAHLISDDKIVLDITSTKIIPSKSMYYYIKSKALIIPTHPMFWPGNFDLTWQNIILTPNKKTISDYRYKLFKKYLTDLNLNIIETTPKKHDTIMWVIQWLTHYNLFVFAETLKKLKISPTDIDSFSTPVYNLIINSSLRYIWQPLDVFADIQVSNNQISRIEKTFVDSAKEFLDISENNKKDIFIDKWQELKKFLWNKQCNYSQKYTDKIFYNISKEKNILLNYIWKTIYFDNIYSKQIKSWILSKYDKDYFYIWEDKYELVEYIITNNK